MTICYFTHEIHPVCGAGAGTLIYNFSRKLLGEGHKVIIALDSTLENEKKAIECLPAVFDDSNISIFPVTTNSKPVYMPYDGLGYEFYANSMKWEQAFEDIYRIFRPDIVEFPDFFGRGKYSIEKKITENKYPNTQIVTRAHNSVEYMDAADKSTEYNLHHATCYNFERFCLKHSDYIAIPSEIYEKKHLRPLYGKLNCEVVEPPVIDYPARPILNKNRNTVLYFGRIVPFKSVDIFIDYSIRMLDKGLDYQFKLIGSSEKMAPDNSDNYLAFLIKRIPEKYIDKYTFQDSMDWDQLSIELSDVRFAFLPSTKESFGYVTYELANMGIDTVIFEENVASDSLTGTGKIHVAQKNFDSFLSSVDSISRNQQGMGLPSFQKSSYPIVQKRENIESPSISHIVLSPPDEFSPNELIPVREDDNVYYAKVSKRKQGSFFFLGCNVDFYDDEFNEIHYTEIDLKDGFLLSAYNDHFESTFIRRARNVLSNTNFIAYTSYRKHEHGLFQIEYDVNPGTALMANSLLRCVFRKDESVSCISELFEGTFDSAGEVAYLYDGLNSGKTILVDTDALYYSAPFRHTFRDTSKSAILKTLTNTSILQSMLLTTEVAYSNIPKIPSIRNQVLSKIGKFRIVEMLLPRESLPRTIISSTMKKKPNQRQSGSVSRDSIQSTDLIKKLIIEFEEQVNRLTSQLDNDRPVSICNPNWRGIRSSTENLYNKNILYVDERYVSIENYIVQRLLDTKIRVIVVQGMPLFYENLIKSLNSNGIVVLAIFHGSLNQFSEKHERRSLTLLLELHAKKIIQRIGFVKKGMEKTFLSKGYDAFFIANYIPMKVNRLGNRHASNRTRIGVFNSWEWRKTAYSSIAASSLIDNHQLNILNGTFEAEQLCTLLKINNKFYDYLPQEEVESFLAEQDINLNITFSECAPMLPLESLSVGVPCLTGPNHHYFLDHEYLRKKLVVDMPDNEYVISRYIIDALESRADIIKEYIKYNSDYQKYVLDLLADFERI